VSRDLQGRVQSGPAFGHVTARSLAGSAIIVHVVLKKENRHRRQKHTQHNASSSDDTSIILAHAL